MHKRITLLLATLLVGGVLWAQTASDGFNYPASSSIAGNGEAGNGWASAWFVASDMDTSAVKIGGILNETLPARTANNRAVVVSTAALNRFQRTFETALDPAIVTEFWFSAHMAIDGTPGGNVGTMSLVDTTTNTEGMTFGKRFGNRNVFATGAGAGPTNTGLQFQGTDARWLVGHVTVNGAGAWELDMWVDPNPSTAPAEGDAQIMNKEFPNRTFHAVRIKSEGAAGIDYSVDDIYFGSSFAEVVPADLVPIGAFPAGATEKFAYDAGDSLSQVTNSGDGWDGDWMLRGDLSPVIAEGGITSEALMRQTSGNHVAASANTRIVRRLDGQYGDVGRTFWIGYWFQTENAGPNVSHFVLADEAALTDSGGAGRLAQIGSGFNNANIAIVGGGGQSGTGISSAEARFVVLEVVTNGTDAADEIYVYIDPALDAQPSRESANALGLRDLGNWNAIALLQAGTVGVTARWDNIQIGDAWEDVIPDDLTDTSTPQTAIAFDQFNYNEGADVDGSGGANDGWTGAWDTIATESAEAVVNAGGLANNTLLARTSTNSYRGTSNGANNRVIRFLENPITQDANPTVWFSTHMSVDGVVGNNVGTMVFADTTQGNYERIVIGKRFGNRNLFATGPGSGATNSGSQFEDGSARWVVGKLTTTDTSDAWVLNLWVDPATDAEPDSAAADILNKIYPTATFHGISLKTEGNAGLNFNADDIFLGGTFADVVPTDFEPLTEAPPGAVETFDYSPMDSLGGQMGGSGWDGEWTVVADNNAPITEEGITSFPLLKQTSGNKVTFNQNGQIVRRLEGTYGDQGRTHWVGFWFDSANGGPNVTNLVIADADNFPGGAGELLQIGRSFNGTNLRIIAQGTTTASAFEGHWVVLELVGSGNADADEVYMWVDPATDAQPSRDEADVVGTLNMANWNAIGLKVAGEAGVTAEWDDIYVGNSFAEIVPGDLLDVMDPTEPVVAVEPFDYTAGEDLNTQNGGTGWLSGWEQIAGTATIAEGSIDSDRVDGAGNKVGLTQSADPVTYERPYFARFAEDSPEKSTVWMTFLLDVTDNAIGNSGTVSLVDGTTEIFAVGATAGTSNIAVTYNGQAPQASTSVSANGVNWVVVQMDLYGTGVADTARVWINPLSDVLPDPEEATFTITDLDVSNGFDRVRVSAMGAQSLSMFADEIYTGFSFRDVSPGFGSDDPDLLVYEPFNYPAGESLIGQGGINAFWDGVWTDASGLGEVNELTITEGSIDQPELEEIGNKAEFGFFESGVNMRVDRELAFPILSDGRTYWITFLMNTTEGAALDNVSNMTLRSSGVAANGGQRLSIGRQFGDGLLGFVTPSSGNSRRSEVLDEGLHWLVMRIKTATEGPADSVAMWIDPPADVEPDTSTAFNVSNIGVLEGAPIDIIRFRVDGSGANQTPYVTNFDELRIATSWESARLSTNVIEPAEDDVFFLGAFPNPFGEELNVTFSAAEAGRYDLELIDLNGRVVSKIFSGNLPVGDQQIQWNNNGLDNGFYVLRISHGSRSTVRKLILYR